MFFILFYYYKKMTNYVDLVCSVLNWTDSH